MALYFKNGLTPDPKKRSLEGEQTVLEAHVQDLNAFFDSIDFELQGNNIIATSDGVTSTIAIYSPLGRPQTGVQHLSALTERADYCQVNFYDSREMISLYDKFDEDDWG